MLPLEYVIIAFFIGYKALKSLMKYNAKQREKERLKN
jgi:hypothetical protein